MDKLNIIINERCKIISFPLIAILKDCIVIYRSIEQLQLNSLHSFKTQYFDNSLLFCKNNNNSQSIYKIVKTTQRKSISNILLKLFGATKLIFVVEDVTDSFGIDYLKRCIVDDIDKGGTWEERGDFRGLAAKVEECNSIEDILCLLG
jgi:hypothetical protein